MTGDACPDASSKRSTGSSRPSRRRWRALPLVTHSRPTDTQEAGANAAGALTISAIQAAKAAQDVAVAIAAKANPAIGGPLGALNALVTNVGQAVNAGDGTDVTAKNVKAASSVVSAFVGNAPANALVQSAANIAGVTEPGSNDLNTHIANFGKALKSVKGVADAAGIQTGNLGIVGAVPGAYVDLSSATQKAGEAGAAFGEALVGEHRHTLQHHAGMTGLRAKLAALEAERAQDREQPAGSGRRSGRASARKRRDDRAASVARGREIGSSRCCRRAYPSGPDSTPERNDGDSRHQHRHCQ